MSISTLYEPVVDGHESGLWITSSYDATSHFESASQDVLDMYAKIFGEELDLEDEEEEEEE